MTKFRSNFKYLFLMFVLPFLVPIGEVSGDELLNRYLKEHYPDIKPEWVYTQEAETFDWIGAGKFVKIGPVEGASDGWAIEVENKVDGIFLQWGKNLLDKTSLVKHIPYQYLVRIKIPRIKNRSAPVFKVDGWEIPANGLPENQWVLVPIPAPGYLHTLKDAACDK